MSLLRLFERSSNDYAYIRYRLKMEKHFNFDNFMHIPKWKIKAFFKIREEKDFLRYRFEILKKWMHKNEFYDREYIEKLEKIIDKFFLRLELNSYEYEYLNHYHNIVFAKIRNLKNLICDFPVDKNEKVYYKYENVGLYKLQDNVMLPIQKSGEIFITTKKILLNRDISIYPIDFETIVDYKVSMRGLEIYTKHNIYILKCYDDYLIYTSLERIFKLQGIKL